jgi:hypothetical protein
MLEQWPELRLGVMPPTEAVSNARQMVPSELQGDLYD